MLANEKGALRKQLQVSGVEGMPSCPLGNISFPLFQHLFGFSPKGSYPDDRDTSV